MSEDAIYFLDLFKLQLGSLREELLDPRIRPDKFDRFSYSAWAIEETIKAINDIRGYVSVGLIRYVLHEQMDAYHEYYSNNFKTQERYMHAFDTVEYLFNLTGGYIHE